MLPSTKDMMKKYLASRTFVKEFCKANHLKVNHFLNFLDAEKTISSFLDCRDSHPLYDYILGTSHARPQDFRSFELLFYWVRAAIIQEVC